MKKLTFKVKGAKGSPRWREAEAEGTTCPRCLKKMTVVVSAEGMYAHCCACGKYYTPEGS